MKIEKYDDKFTPEQSSLTSASGRRTAAPANAAAILLFLCALPAMAQQKTVFPAFEVSSGTPLLSQAASTGAVVGQGGNYSLPLSDGRTLWFLNNIWTGERKADGQSAVWGVVDGAAALSVSSAAPAGSGSLSYVSDENKWPLPLLSGDMKEYSQARKFWPRSGFSSGGRYYVFFSIMNNYGPDTYDYFRVGQGLAWSDDPRGPYQKARHGEHYSFWNDIEPAFGSAVLQDGDGWVYVYGRLTTAPGEHAAALARVRPEDAASLEKYSYYSVETASGTWSGDCAESAPVMEKMPDEFSVSYNEFLKSYLAVYFDPESGSVTARRAPYPWGPWSGGVPLFSCRKEDYCYGAKEQPGFASAGGGRIFLTLEKKNAPYLYQLTFK